MNEQLKFPEPTNPSLISEPDIVSAVYDFIYKYGLPQLSDQNILNGYNNRVALPNDKEYAVFWVLYHIRRGTDGTTWENDIDDPTKGTYSKWELVETDVQIDFYSEPYPDNARRRCQAIETTAMSYLGTRFFGEHHIGCHYATDPKNLSYQDSTEQYISRWSTTLHLTYYTGVTTEVPFIEAKNITLKNVDVECPPEANETEN